MKISSLKDAFCKAAETYRRKDCGLGYSGSLQNAPSQLEMSQRDCFCGSASPEHDGKGAQGSGEKAL